MPIYWNKADPSVTQAISGHDLLNFVHTNTKAAYTLHPKNAALGYTSGTRPIDSGASYYPNNKAGVLVRPGIWLDSAMTNQIAFARPGWRPLTSAKIWDSGGSAGTWQLTKAQLGNVDYIIAWAWGSGGGSTTGFTAGDNRVGGSSGGFVMAIIELASTGCSVTVGAGGTAITSFLGVGDGNTGGASTVSTLGGSIYAGPGGGGKNNSPQPGGSVTAVGNYGDCYVVESKAGNVSGHGTGSYGGQTYGTYNEHSPEGTLVYYPNATTTATSSVYGVGGEAPGYGSGNGKAGQNGRVVIWY